MIKLKKIFLNLSQETLSPINFFQNLPIRELIDWIEIINNKYELMKKKMR